MKKKIYNLRIVVDRNGEVEEIYETLDYDRTALLIRGVDMSEFLDDEANELIQGCNEVGLS
tara:strand:- start:3215 stop:3397 length:183 start_codon:yes stop_codon:yes gene_type:complete